MMGKLSEASMFLALCLSIWIGCGSGRPDPDPLITRCDHAKLTSFVQGCVASSKAGAGDSDGIAQDCYSAGHSMYCEYSTKRTSIRAWRYVDGRWKLPEDE